MTSVNEIIELAGREELVTSYTEKASIEDILSDMIINLPKHYQNAEKIAYLNNYWKGKQAILDRVKVVREDIDNKVVINLAQSSTRMITGYTFGKPIEFIHRKEADADDLETLNNCFRVEHKPMVDGEIFTDLSVAGIGYRMVTPRKGYRESDYESGVSPFTLTRLDPQNTFVVYSTSIPKRVIYSCTYYEDLKYNEESGDTVTYTIFTVYMGRREYRFRVPGAAPNNIDLTHLEAETTNLLGSPIVEYRNNKAIAGDWEFAITILDALNVVASDSVNDVVQFVQSLLVFINAELDEGDIATLKSDKMLSIFSPENLKADVKYISEQLDSAGVQTLREWLEEKFDTVVGIPDRKTRGGGGGDTGEAVKLRDGWGDLEVLARSKEPYVRKGEMETLILALNTIKSYNLIEELKIYDIEIKFSRNKNDNLLVKTQSYSNLISTETIAPEDAMDVCDFTNDTKEVASKGEKYWSEKSKDDSDGNENTQNSMN